MIARTQFNRSRPATYGAIVLPTTAGGAPEVLTAPAASSAVTPLLTTIAGEVQTQLTQQITAAGGDASAVKVKTTAVVPLSSDDATGSGLAAAAFPMTMGGMLGGILLSLLVVGPMRRLAGLLGFAVATGLIVTIVLQPWFHFLQGDFWINALAIGLSVLATSAFIVGCTSLLGRAGVAIGAVLTLLVGSPLSAAAPWQFLPAAVPNSWSRPRQPNSRRPRRHRSNGPPTPPPTSAATDHNEGIQAPRTRPVEGFPCVLPRCHLAM